MLSWVSVGGVNKTVVFPRFCHSAVYSQARSLCFPSRPPLAEEAAAVGIDSLNSDLRVVAWTAEERADDSDIVCFFGCCGCSHRLHPSVDGEHLSFDRLSAVSSTMASAGSGE